MILKKNSIVKKLQMTLALGCQSLGCERENKERVDKMANGRFHMHFPHKMNT
jgi:hypothetical protein